MVEECRAQDFERDLEGFVAIRAAATKLLVEFMAVESC